MEIKFYKIEEKDQGIRLDRWFYRNNPTMPFTLVAKLIRKGQVRLDSKRVKISTRVRCNQILRVPLIKYDCVVKEKLSVPSNFKNITAKLFDSIIYEDKHIIVINKPYGLCVQDGSKVSISIDKILKLSNLQYNIVHRLDKETTGVIIIAKSPNVASEIGTLFKERKMSKSYLVIVHGKPRISEGTIDSIIQTSNFIAPKKMHAITKFKVLNTYKNLFSFVQMFPFTGRKHQIRIHSNKIGCPILGDAKYHSKRIKKDILDSKLHLHSHSLEFKLFNKKYSFRAILPEHFKRSLENIFQVKDISNL